MRSLLSGAGRLPRLSAPLSQGRNRRRRGQHFISAKISICLVALILTIIVIFVLFAAIATGRTLCQRRARHAGGLDRGRSVSHAPAQVRRKVRGGAHSRVVSPRQCRAGGCRVGTRLVDDAVARVSVSAIGIGCDCG